MRCVPVIGVLLCVGLLATSSVLAREPRPGMWEFTSQMQMQHMSMPGQTFRHCLTAKDIADRKQYTMSSGDIKCSMSNFKQQGNQISYDLACTMPQGKMTGSAKGTSSPESLSMDMTSRFTPPIHGMAQMNQHLTAKRVGECP